MSAHEHEHMPLKTYFIIYVALLCLTVLTVAVSVMGLPSLLSIVVAMAVATVKALLVATWFMHLKYDRKFNVFVFGASFWFMAVFFIFTMTDLSSRGDILAVTGNFEQRMDAALAEENAPPLDPDATPEELGQALYSGKGCIGCHSLDGSKMVGPSFKGLHGREEVMADGTKLTADDAYIKESILQPQAKIVEGYPPVMQ
ncbi:MAG: caa(3)-type oxidase subunit IV, partial [Cognaticolwellia sp.]